jgi:hypothetical protein
LCLEHLMSCIVLVVEDHGASSSSSNYEASSSSSTRRISFTTQVSCDSNEMEGFIWNASQLVLHNNCAGAA